MKHLYVFLLCLLFFASHAQPAELPAYKNPQLPLEERVKDLISRMTLEEKISQMGHDAPAVPRLDIPKYNWWNECLHGVARAGHATVFPQAATWDDELMFRIADIISTEARAKHHEFVRQGQRNIYQGLTFWSPNINIFRDPRWGRGQETYGEDPYLTARMGVAFVKGLQGNDPKYLKVVSTPKHYAVHSGPEPERHTFDAIASKRDMMDTYLPAFEATVREAGAWSVMCAYNRTNGEACCAHQFLEGEMLRGKWGFQGYVVSDCGAIFDIYAHHKLVPTPEEAAALAVKRGTDLECGDVYQAALYNAVHNGLITEQEIDRALTRLFTARFKLGMFDPPEMVPYAQIPYSENDKPEHRQVALEAARKSIVLLKNDGILPLKKDIKAAVIGPTADSYAMLVGNYNGTPSKYVTPLQGIRNKLGAERVLYALGCNLADDNPPSERVPTEALRYEGMPGLRAEYYRGVNFDELLTVRVDKGIYSNWVTEPVDGMGDTNFSVRWTGKLVPPVTGEYLLTLVGDDGYRLIIDGKLILEDWTYHAPRPMWSKVYLEAGREYDIKVEYFQGGGGAEMTFLWAKPGVDYLKEALDAAAAADVVIFVGGITAELEGEEMEVPYEGFRGGDRTSLDLPKVQENLLKRLHQTGKPIVLVLTSGSALAVNWANANLPAILELWYPGEEGGTALADVLFGDYNPGGRLPVTFYKSVDQLPPFEDYNMQGRTYRYFTGEPLYAFGYGLSYTSFAYSDFKLPKKSKLGKPVRVSVKVKNTGMLYGEEVVQLYVKHLDAPFDVPLQALQGFKRIGLKPGETKVVEFELTEKNLSIIDAEGNLGVKPGRVQVAVGGGVPGFVPPTSGSLKGIVAVK
ncbi:MAG: glycoside hydrolase family 3 C-terminal domain-containing protein [candidate division KSB1 bacterium]|nr:glycoside hydrolase family 3 C-terminal domain-containing protein [candidate division KSB1 bacterium]